MYFVALSLSPPLAVLAPDLGPDAVQFDIRGTSSPRASASGPSRLGSGSLTLAVRMCTLSERHWGLGPLQQGRFVDSHVGGEAVERHQSRPGGVQPVGRSGRYRSTAPVHW